MIEALFVSNILLWIAVVVMAFIILALVRQVGVLYERVAPAGALMLNSRLKVGDAAPELEVRDINGKLHSLGLAAKAGRSLLIFFLSPTCPVCKTLLPVVKSAKGSEAAWLDVMLASDGPDLNHAGLIAEHGLGDFTYVVSELLGRSLGVGKLPYAVLIDEKGKIASLGIINSREHLESLFEAKRLGVASIQDYISENQGRC